MQGQQNDQLACLLELDPDLGRELGDADFEQARAACRPRLVRVAAGLVDVSAARDGRSAPVGFLIIDGMVCREVRLRDHHVIELLGPGDVLQPSPREAQSTPVVGPTITVVRDLLAAELGTAFVRCAAKWPELLGGVLDRIDQQHQRLVAQELVVHLRRADERLLVMLWLLANRWGYVTPEGIHLRFRLTHDVLGQLIAAQRSTVTLALRALERNETVIRMAGGGLLLTAKAERAVRRITSTTPAPPVGDTLRLLDRATALQDDAKALRADAKQIAAFQQRRAGGNRHTDAESDPDAARKTVLETGRSDRGPGDAARAAAVGAENAGRRAAVAAAREAELAERHTPPASDPHQAGDRAAKAARAAEVARIRAIEAHERAAEEHHEGPDHFGRPRG
jgi:CRP-like cAMP-binding protein